MFCFFKDLHYTLGSLAAQSLKNTDRPHVHLGPHCVSASYGPGAAADLGTCYGESLLSSGSGAGGHLVVLCVSGCGRHGLALVCGRELAQSPQDATLGRGEAVRGRG